MASILIAHRSAISLDVSLMIDKPGFPFCPKAQGKSQDDAESSLNDQISIFLFLTKI